MERAINNSLIGKIADSLGINKKFHQYKETNIDPRDKALISPVEGKMECLVTPKKIQVVPFSLYL